MKKIVFYSVVLNQHQAPVADYLWEMTNHQYVFVELISQGSSKGSTEDFSSRPYLLRAWESEEKYEQAMVHARTAECCVFSGVKALPFEKERMKLNLLSFDMGERWLKHGVKSFASPRLLKWLAAYWFGGWRHKPLYKLCCSAFCAKDHNKMFTFKEKCYKWGYFTKDNTINRDFKCAPKDVVFIMWCSRFLNWKHPEIPILLSQRLKQSGHNFKLDIYGNGNIEKQCKEFAQSIGVSDVVTFHGAASNAQIRQVMSEHDIFLFTSDKREGWGAVANESMSEGCVLVASDAIGSSPYLIVNGENGFIFHSSKTSCSFNNPDKIALNSIYKYVNWLLNHPKERLQMQENAYIRMAELWSPINAAKSLLRLIEDIKLGRDSSILEGPCSKA